MQMATENENAACPSVIPRDAACIDCGYSLFALERFRCPECGRAFDPRDGRTMWRGRAAGRWVRFLLTPVGMRTRWLVMIACIAIVWGFAWLPGALILTLGGFVLALLMLLYIVARSFISALLKLRFGEPFAIAETDDRMIRRVGWIAVVLCIASLFDLPRRANLYISRPFLLPTVMHAWTEVPAIDAYVPAGLYGGLLVERAWVGPHGVRLKILGAGYIFITESADGKVQVIDRAYW
jgi:hypothetical protein